MLNNNLNLLVVALLVSSCAMVSKNDGRNSSSPLSESGIDPKYSLAKDRSEFDKLRESVPPEIKQQNDEKALIAELTADLKYAPDVAREKFNTIVRRKREIFSKDMSKIREDFNRDEKEKRDDFLNELQEEREAFLKRKVDSDKRSAFFSEQDEARRTFFAEQREKRDEFESDFRARRKDFDDYIKDKTDIFNAELKDYNIRWREKLEAEKAASQNSN
jgi:hypothetical protein